MLDFARSNTIGTQTSNIYLNQLQWYGQFGEVYMLLKVLSLEIMSRLTGSDRSPFRCINSRPPRPDRRSPETASP